jgi:diaminobutyrate-2-oxoglutarate transaminase
MKYFENIESNVRSYCRSYPVVFEKAKDSFLYTETGKQYIDFLAGAGALNYGHNNDFIKEDVVSFIQSDQIMHGLDMYTKVKRNFIAEFYETILRPRAMLYKLQFCAPTGTNAVEAALKLARKMKGRTGVFAFMGAFHGMSLGSLSVTSNKFCRAGAGQSLGNVTFVPYPDGAFGNFDTIDYIERLITDTHSGIEKPAAIIFETVQAEGGVNVATHEWLKRLRDLCNRHDILLICDDIQVGCGRCGSFFSFERAQIQPDMIILSKSISGYGIPMSLLLIKPELDLWEPGEHNGTFRGNQLAFVAACSALKLREKEKIEEQVKDKEAVIKEYLDKEIKPLHKDIEIRGIGMIWGIDLAKVTDADTIKQITTRCFECGLIIERVGRNDCVIKIMPSLIINKDILSRGCEIIKESMLSILM